MAADSKTSYFDNAMSLLAGYEPFESADSAYALTLSQSFELGPKIFKRDTFIPGHMTASAWVVSEAGTHVLLVHHTKTNNWWQPGGHFDFEHDTTLLDTARREVQEETGVHSLELLEESPYLVTIFDFPQKGDEPAHKHFDLCFAFRLNGKQGLASSSETKDAQWVAITDIDSYEPDNDLDRMRRKWLKVYSC